MTRRDRSPQHNEERETSNQAVGGGGAILKTTGAFQQLNIHADPWFGPPLTTETKVTIIWLRR